MKKIIGIAGIVVVVAAGWAGASWYTGKKMQEAVMQYVALINQRLDAKFPSSGQSMRIASYRRGIFTSDIRFEWQPRKRSRLFTSWIKKQARSELEPLVFEAHIEHGPFAMGAFKAGHFLPVLGYLRAQLVPTGKVNRWFAATAPAASDSVPFSFEQVISYKGNTTYRWHLKPMSLTSQNGSTLHSGDITGHGTYLRSTGAIDAHVEAAPVTFQIAGKNAANAGVFPILITLSGFNADTQGSLDPSGFLPGTSTVKMANLGIAFSQCLPLPVADAAICLKTIAFNKITESSTLHSSPPSADSDAILLNNRNVFDIDAMQINHVALGSGHIVFGADSIDSEAWRQFQAMLGQGFPGLFGMIEPLQRLLDANPALTLELSNTAPGSEQRVTLHAVLMPPRLLRGFSLLSVKADGAWVFTPAQWQDVLAQLLQPQSGNLMHENIASAATISPELATKAVAANIVRQWTQKMVAAHFVKVDGDKLVGQFNYDDVTKILNLNSTSASLADLVKEWGKKGPASN